MQLLPISTFLLLISNAEFHKSYGIFHGKDSVPKQFPYMVCIKTSFKKDERGFYCGGSLISNEWILTAAHCTLWTIKIEVFLGDIHYCAGVSHEISFGNVFFHDNYEENSYANDICLIKIPSTRYTAAIQNVQLPFSDNDPYIGVTGIAAGWGYTSANGEVSEILKYIEPTVIKNIVCKKKNYKPLRETQLCASSKTGASLCDGDSGGPLVYKLNENYVQIGIASLISNPNCESGYPYIYTRVSSYMNWINKITKTRPKYSEKCFEDYPNTIELV